jgi:hypothetical protein
MAQTVYDVGEPITSRLKLGITPDGTTTATVTVKRPDGTVITGLTASGWGGTGGDEKTVQFYATDDGVSGSATDSSAGDWLVVWRVTGTGASVTPKVYSVRALPDTVDYPGYIPFLSDIADHVPWLTLDNTAPGADTFLGTFTGSTWPQDDQVHRLTRLTTLPISARWPVLSDSVHELARAYIALRVAAQLARSYPRGEGDLATADRLAAEADALWASLTELADNSATGPDPAAAAQVPVWSFPAPVSWGDDYL